LYVLESPRLLNAVKRTGNNDEVKCVTKLLKCNQVIQHNYELQNV